MTETKKRKPRKAPVKKPVAAPVVDNDESLATRNITASGTPVEQPEPETNHQESSDRPTRRRSFGAPERKLAVPERDGFVRRWVRDDVGRLQYFEDCGYNYVLRKEIDPHIGVKGSPTSKVYMHGGTRDDGSSMKLYLMEQRLEWYKEDQKEKQKPVDEIDRAIREGSLGSNGLQAHERYLPDGGIKIS